MDMLDWLVANLGGRLTEEESRAYACLCHNRKIAAAHVPPDLRRAFLGALFPRRELKNIVRFTFREEGVRANPCGYFEDCLGARIGVKDFGIKLLTRHRLNPDEFLAILLEGCDLSGVAKPA